MIGVPELETAAATWFGGLATLALEASLLAVLVVLIVRCGKRLSSPLRHGLLVLALLKFLLPPVAVPWSPARYLPALGTVPATTADEPTHGLTRVGEPSLDPPGSAHGAPGEATEDRIQRRRERPATAGAETASGDDAAGVAPAVEPKWLANAPSPLALLFLVQAVGAALLVVRHGIQRARLARLARRCVSLADSELDRVLDHAARRQRLRRAPMLVGSPDRLGPAAAGLLRRRIVLPLEVVDGIPAGRLAPVLEHEVAHHRRLDLWTDVLVFVGALVWWPNPVYWLVARELRRVREDCCDAAALAIVSPGTYCHCLLDIAAVLGERRPPLPALAHGGLTHPLASRIRRIMTDPRPYRPRLSASATVLLVAAALLLLPTGSVTGAPEAAPSPVREAALSPERAEVSPPELEPMPMPEPTGARLTPPETAQSLGVDDHVVKLSRDLIDVLVVERGLDREFVEQFDGAPDRRISLAELRGWSRYGVEAALPDELAAWGLDELRVSELIRLVWARADAAYLRSLRELGYAAFDLDDAIRLARYEVTAGWIEGWRTAGYDDLDTDDLVRLRRYEVESEYAATYHDAGYELSVDDLVRLHRYEVDEDAASRLAEAGLDDFSVDDLIRLKRYEVDDAYVRAMTDDGELELSVDDLVRLKRYEVAPEYFAAMSASGIDPSVDDLIRLRRYEVAPELPAQLTAMGYTDIGVDELVQLRRYEVSMETVRALADSGYGVMRADELIQLHRYEVTAAFVRGLRDATSRTFSVDELVTLRRYEVTPDFIGEMTAAGFGELSTDDLVRLRRYEVTGAFVQRLRDAGFDDLTVDKVIRLRRADG